MLEKKVVIVNGQKMITLGDNQLEWNETFMLYMTTKLSNPKYTPEAGSMAHSRSYHVNAGARTHELST